MIITDVDIIGAYQDSLIKTVLLEIIPALKDPPVAMIFEKCLSGTFSNDVDEWPDYFEENMKNIISKYELDGVNQISSTESDEFAEYCSEVYLKKFGSDPDSLEILNFNPTIIDENSDVDVDQNSDENGNSDEDNEIDSI